MIMWKLYFKTYKSSPIYPISLFIGSGWYKGSIYPIYPFTKFTNLPNLKNLPIYSISLVIGSGWHKGSIYPIYQDYPSLVPMAATHQANYHQHQTSALRQG